MERGPRDSTLRYRTIEPTIRFVSSQPARLLRSRQPSPAVKMENLATYFPPQFHPVMELLEPHTQWLSIALVSISALYLTTIYVSHKRESAVPFNVPLPPEIRSNYNWAGKNWDDITGEKKRVLENQARGQWDKDLIMSYCPADGRVLGNGVQPATREVVEKAVEDAASAQVEWAKTGFAERRKVLRTLLRCAYTLPLMVCDVLTG